jgi:hypothetical protein
VRKATAPTKTLSRKRPWTKDELRALKAMARKEPVTKIAKTLKRTSGATRQKATQAGISLRLEHKKRKTAKAA